MQGGGVSDLAVGRPTSKQPEHTPPTITSPISPPPPTNTSTSTADTTSPTPHHHPTANSDPYGSPRNRNTLSIYYGHPRMESTPRSVPGALLNFRLVALSTGWGRGQCDPGNGVRGGKSLGHLGQRLVAFHIGHP